MTTRLLMPIKALAGFSRAYRWALAGFGVLSAAATAFLYFDIGPKRAGRSTAVLLDSTVSVAPAEFDGWKRACAARVPSLLGSRVSFATFSSGPVVPIFQNAVITPSRTAVFAAAFRGVAQDSVARGTDPLGAVSQIAALKPSPARIIVLTDGEESGPVLPSLAPRIARALRGVHVLFMGPKARPRAADALEAVGARVLVADRRKGPHRALAAFLGRPWPQTAAAALLASLSFPALLLSAAGFLFQPVPDSSARLLGPSRDAPAPPRPARPRVWCGLTPHEGSSDGVARVEVNQSLTISGSDLNARDGITPRIRGQWQVRVTPLGADRARVEVLTRLNPIGVLGAAMSGPLDGEAILHNGDRLLLGPGANAVLYISESAPGQDRAEARERSASPEISLADSILG